VDKRRERDCRSVWRDKGRWVTSRRDDTGIGSESTRIAAKEAQLASPRPGDRSPVPVGVTFDGEVVICGAARAIG
jgi:hypothetical protein